MCRLISWEAVKWQHLQCKEPSAVGSKSKSLVAPEVTSQLTLAVVFKTYSEGKFPLTFLTCATLTRGDLRRDTKRRAWAGDGESEATANWDKEQHMGVWGGWIPRGHSFNYLSGPWCRDHSPTDAQKTSNSSLTIRIRNVPCEASR